MPEEKPKSNMDIALDAIKAELTAEIARPRPNYVRIKDLVGFLHKQSMMRRRSGFVGAGLDISEREELAAAVREEIENATPDGYVGSEEDDIPPITPAPGRFVPMGNARLTPMPTIPADVQGLIDKVIEISPFQADKAKKMLECAQILVNCATSFDQKEKADSVFEFAQKLREKAMDILRPEFGDMAEEVKPAIRKLDLEDSDEVK